MVVYSFQHGLRFLLQNFREFRGEVEDSRRPTNTKLLEHNLVKNFEVSIVYIQHIWNIRYIRYILDIQLNSQSNENVVLNVIHFRVYWDFDSEEENFRWPKNTKLIRQNLARNFVLNIIYIQNKWNIRYIRYILYYIQNIWNIWYILNIRLNRQTNENLVLNVIHSRVY